MSSWVMAEISAFSSPVRKPGTGSPSMAPMATYIRGMRRTIDATSRRFMDFRSCSAAAWRFFHSPRKPCSPAFPVPAGRDGSAP